MAQAQVVLPFLAAAVAVLLLLSPSVAMATSSSSPLSSSSTGGGGGEQEDASSVAPPPPPPPLDPETQKQKEKEHEAMREKAVAEEKAAQQELLEYAKQKRLVSPTNGTGWYKGIAREFLNAHNELRQRYGVPPMRWDKALARDARRWSNAMRRECKMLHSGHETGQSVFRSHDDWNATAAEAVLWWSKEEPIYDKNKEKCLGGREFKECGHFALMVAKRSTKVGCARAECFKGGVFITCNYYATDLADKDKNKKKQSSSSSTASSSSGSTSSSNYSPPPPPPPPPPAN